MGWRRWLGFAVLCGWQATAWLVPPVAEGPSATERLALACLLVGLCAVSVMMARRIRISTAPWGKIAVAAVLLIGVPAVLVQSASESSTDTNTAIVFALTPVVAVLVWGAVSNAEMPMASLLAALVGAAGVLVVLPYELPVSTRAWGALAEIVLAMGLTGVGSVWIYRLIRTAHVTPVMLVAAAGNLVFLILSEVSAGHLVLRGWSVAGWVATFVQAIVFVLTVWLAEAIEPVRFSARFLIVPLLTIVEGVVLLRPGIDARLVAGVGLLVVGVGWLFAGEGRVDEKVLSLR